MMRWILLVFLFAVMAALAEDPPKPIVASPTDQEWIKSSNFTRPPGISRTPVQKVRVHGVESLNAPYWRLDTALKMAFLDQYRYTWSYDIRPSYGFVRNRNVGFPSTWEEVYDEDVYVVLGAAVGQGLSQAQRCMLEQFVKDGGGLLICGGYWCFGSGGGWAGTVFDDLAPVVSPPTTSLWEWNSQFHPLAGPQFGEGFEDQRKLEPTPIPPGSPTGLPLVAAGKNPITDGLKWNAAPLVMVSHKIVQVKQGATTLVTCDGKPMVVTSQYGKGRVAIILAQPLGEAPKGKIAYWDWPDWPALMGRLIRWVWPQGR